MSSHVPFVWSDAFALGYRKMDETHREFVETVNAMLNASDADFASALDAFADHAKRHFDEEALWMNSTDFPAAGCHIDEHNAVLHSVEEVQAAVAQGNVEIGRRLAAELQRWFPGHADYLDSALAQWMVKRAAGGVPVVFRRNATGAVDGE
ncbi:MAG: hemerythrin [Hydrogenophilales bacterium 17-64-11]|nr:MAG: hemerythrin [Hydrogenophilales bacterium 17-64-11]